MPAPTTTVSTSCGRSPRASQKEGTLANEDASAVDVEDLARDVAGEGGGQEEDGGGDVLRRRDALERDRGEHLSAPLPREGVGGHVRIHPAGRDRVDADPGGELGRPGLGGRDQRSLAGCVGAVESLA